MEKVFLIDESTVKSLVMNICDKDAFELFNERIDVQRNGGDISPMFNFIILTLMPKAKGD